MSQYPVENEAGVYEAINYLLSGPAGLGQNFEGFATFVPAYITGTFRAPFTVPIDTVPPPTWYVAPISISDIQPLNVDPGTGETNTIEITFASAQANPPFLLGDTIRITGVNPSFYNGRYNRSVVYCDTTKVVIQASQTYVWPAYVSGGNIGKNNSNANTSTDCNARVTVFGPTDQVFVSAQINLDVSYTCSEASEFDIAVRINRYQGFIDTTDLQTPIANRDYLFDFDETVSQKVYSFSVSTSGTESLEAIFTTVLDRPSFGYYWYILEVDFITEDENEDPLPGDAQPDVLEVGLRSLTAQVIKQ